jgi:hypothetical protein
MVAYGITRLGWRADAARRSQPHMAMATPCHTIMAREYDLTPAVVAYAVAAAGFPEPRQVAWAEYRAALIAAAGSENNGLLDLSREYHEVRLVQAFALRTQMVAVPLSSMIAMPVTLVGEQLTTVVIVLTDAHPHAPLHGRCRHCVNGVLLHRRWSQRQCWRTSHQRCATPSVKTSRLTAADCRRHTAP